MAAQLQVNAEQKVENEKQNARNVVTDVSAISSTSYFKQLSVLTFLRKS